LKGPGLATIARRMQTPLRAVVSSWAVSAVLFLVGGCDRKEQATPAADVVADEHGFSPASITLPQGGPGSHATVTFVRTTDKTCATEVVFPELKLEQKLPINQVVSIEVPTQAAQRLGFQCGMGMYKGSLLVTAK
jgi:plastocyanin domain-containing protein